jgi:glycerol-3-phosphate O-acyltransferase 3/4
LFQPSASEVNLYQLHVEDLLSLNSHAEEDPTVTDLDNKLLLWDLLDISPVLTEAASAIIDDSFTRCFKSNTPEPWNWNLYLAPLWCLGVIVRYGILFPIRVWREQGCASCSRMDHIYGTFLPHSHGSERP